MPANFADALPMIIFGVVLLAALIFIFLAVRRTTKVVDRTSGDVLDEGAAKAARNQALIDAPSSVAKDIGQTSANANSDAVAAAGAMADSEAGAQVVPEPMPAQPAVPAPAPAPVPAPVPTPAPMATPAPAPSGEADDLKRIKGVGPKLVAMLAAQGITRFDQIAAWSDADIARIDETMGRFKGRITRDKWVEQARLLSSGDETAFAAKFGNN